MVVYLYGPDSYRRNKQVQFYLDEFKKKHAAAVSIDHFDIAVTGEFDRLKAFIVNQSLFGKGYKFGVVHNIAEADVKEIKAVLEPIMDDKATTVIVSADKKLEKPLHSFFEKSFKPESFDELTEAEFSKFVRHEANARGVKLSAADEILISKTFVGDTWGAVEELEKIALGGKTEKAAAEPELFPLMFAIAKPLPAAKKLSALAWLLAREEPAKVFNIISAQKEPLLQNKMAAYDVAVKSGKLEYEEVLLDLTLSSIER